MTMESGQHEAQPSSADLVRSTASASAELWHEILGRLRVVQESQATLADAIEALGLMVQDALGSESQAKIGPSASVCQRCDARSSGAHRSRDAGSCTRMGRIAEVPEGVDHRNRD